MANDRWSYQVVELGSSFLGPPKPEQIQEKLNQMGAKRLGAGEYGSGIQAYACLQAAGLNALSLADEKHRSQID